MKKLVATLLATAASSSFAFAPTAALNHDPATYRNVTQKAAADYKSATAKCAGMGGNDKEVCQAEAKATRAHAEADALAQYNNTAKGREHARIKLADADYSVAKAKCDAMSGADKDTCMASAKTAHGAALADAKAGRDGSVTVAATTTVGVDAHDQAAANKCANAGGDANTGCLVDNKARVTTAAGATAVTGAAMANRAENATENAADKTRDAAVSVGEKTKELAKRAVEKTKEVASRVANKTENAMDRAGDKTRETASTAAHKTGNAMDRAGEHTRDTAASVAEKTDRHTDHAADKTERVASDSAITTKVKASMFKEPELKSLSIHVKTEQGVVMLSGFVDSKAEAAKAVEVAKAIEGVAKVKSAIKVK